MKIKPFFYLMRLNKWIGIFLLLWPTLWALWLASKGRPDIKIVSIFILGVILMRSAGCIINDIFDRNFDPHVHRTQHRPLASGELTVFSAFILFVALLLIAFLLVWQLNHFAFLLAWIGLVLTIFYPLLKRFTHLPQLGLGIAFAWGVPMAFAAQMNQLPLKAGLLFFAAALWPVIYDTFYAMVDMQDDIKIGVKSTAVLWGQNTGHYIFVLQLSFLSMMCVVGFLFNLHWPYYLSLFFSAVLFSYQRRLICENNPEAYFKAFLNNQWVGVIIFLGIYLSQMNFRFFSFQ